MAGDDLADLKNALRNNCEALARHVLGEPNRALSTRTVLRWGKGGGVRVNLSGRHRGTWHDEGARTKGDMLALIASCHGGGFKSTVDWAYAWTGIDRSKPAITIRPRPVDNEAIAKDASERAAKIASARARWNAGVSISGTIAETYLTQTRRIPCPAAGWRDAVRFHAADRALMLPLATAAGDVQAVQVIYLDEHGKKANRPHPKLTYGPMDGACVRLPGNLPTLIAEGPETGMAAWSATGHATLISCGPVGRLADIPTPAIVLQDDDARHSPIDKALTKALKGWRESGRTVTPVTPWHIRRYDKTDMADLMLTQGPAAVCARIARAIECGMSTTLRIPVSVARNLLPSAFAPLFVAAEAWTAGTGEAPPVHAVRGTTGLGKSYEIRRQVAAHIRTLRAKADPRAVCIAVPRHDLADQYAERMRQVAPELTVRVWRGREQPDPDQPGAKMCGDLDAVKEASAARLDVDTYVCRPCELRDQCAHYRQRTKQTADIWIVPHSLLTSARPKAFGTLALLVIDENPVSEFLIGLDPLHPLHLPLSDFDHIPPVEGNAAATETLRKLHRTAAYILSHTGTTTGALQRQWFKFTGFTHADADAALKLTWDTKYEPEFYPNMSRAERMAVIESAFCSHNLSRRAMFWSAVRDMLADDGPAASGCAALHKGGIKLKGRTPLRAGWQVPTFIADATLELDLLRHIWPRIVLSADIATNAPHQRICQVTNRAYSLAMLDGGKPGKLDAENTKRRASRRRDVHAIICREARLAAPGVTLVIAQKTVRTQLEAMANLPANVEWGHHNALTGMDDWKDARLIIVIGRTLPGPALMEDHAEAPTGRAAERLGPGEWYGRSDATREMADGRLIAAEADQHPDHIAELFRRTVCEHQLTQLIGRGRGGDRTAATPLDVLVMSDVPLDIPINETLAADDLKPSPADLMLAAGGIAYEEPADASRAYPDLFATPDAARKASDRYRTNPYKSTYYGNVRYLSHIRFQREGAGCSQSCALIDLSVTPAPRAAIEAAQGLLASWELLPPEPPPALPPKPAPTVKPGLLWWDDDDARVVPWWEECIPPAIRRMLE